MGLTAAAAARLRSLRSTTPLLRLLHNVPLPYLHTRRFNTSSQTIHSSVPTVVDVSWAAANLSKFRVLDCSWYLDKSRDAYTEYLKQRIVGARFFGLDECVDTSSPYPHMLPSTTFFAFYNAHKLGIKHTDNLLLYDGHGMFSAPRVWLTYNIFGHAGKICIVNGGLPAWLQADLPLAHQSPLPAFHVPDYDVKYRPDMVKSFDDIVENLQSREYTVLDARSAARFNGTAAEPRPIPSGHIPHSVNIPFNEVLTSHNNINTLKNEDELREVFEKKHVNIDAVKSGQQRVITSCGINRTHCIGHIRS